LRDREFSEKFPREGVAPPEGLLEKETGPAAPSGPGAGSEFIGRVSSVERDPSTSASFSFWVKKDAVVNPFDYVSVENQGESRTVGVVKEIAAPTDAPSHLSNFVGSNFGDPGAEGNTRRITTVVAKADVVANTGVDTPYSRTGKRPVWYPVLNDTPVSFATEGEIEVALGMRDTPSEFFLPAGVIVRSAGKPLPLKLDSRYVLGPEAAHVNVSGTSGLAAKTSYLMFLLKAVMHRFGDRTAAILFNVKQRDLLYIDEPPADGYLEPYDREMYGLLDIPAEPFGDVVYYLPWARRHARDVYSDPDKKRVFYYAYTLEDVHDELDLLFSEVEDPQYTIAGITAHIAAAYPRGKLRFRGSSRFPDDTQVKTWEHLKWFDNYPDEVVGRAQREGVVFRFKRHLGRLITNKGIFVESRDKVALKADIEVKYVGDDVRSLLVPGRILVVDIQPFEDDLELQGFVVGDIVRRLKEACRENRQDLPRHIVILIDELNRYVPTGIKLTALGREIIDLARVGRAEGISLFTAQQFRADVHHQVYENCSTSLVGVTGTTELSKPAYDYLDRQTKVVVANLAPGEMVLANRRLKQPVKIDFPKPPYLRQEAR